MVMKIKEIITRNQTDFLAIYECEHCGAEREGFGRDDAHFRNNVILEIKCDQCGKTASED